MSLRGELLLACPDVFSGSRGSNLLAWGDCFGKTKSASQRHVPRLSSFNFLPYFFRAFLAAGFFLAAFFTATTFFCGRYFNAACAAARRAIGTRNGEHET